MLAGPALGAVRRRYPQARLTAVGHPERWGLLSRTLAVDAVWDSGEARWSPLFNDSPPSPQLLDSLAPFQLALVFSHRPHKDLLTNLSRAGIPGVFWIPSFSDSAPEPVAALQARHLAALGLEY